MQKEAESYSRKTPSEEDPPSLEQTLRYAEDLERDRSSHRVLQQRWSLAAPQRHRILIVDDQWTLRLLVSATLDAARYHILEASGGAEALVIARAARPAIIMLDVRMPDLDGIEVCRRIRAEETLREVPIVMLTAAAEESERRAGLAAGANVYLTKPFSPLHLVETIEQLLRGPLPPPATRPRRWERSPAR